MIIVANNKVITGKENSPIEYLSTLPRNLLMKDGENVKYHIADVSEHKSKVSLLKLTDEFSKCSIILSPDTSIHTTKGFKKASEVLEEDSLTIIGNHHSTTIIEEVEVEAYYQIEAKYPVFINDFLLNG